MMKVTYCNGEDVAKGKSSINPIISQRNGIWSGFINNRLHPWYPNEPQTHLFTRSDALYEIPLNRNFYVGSDGLSTE